MTTYQGIRQTYTIIEPRRAKGGEGEIFDIAGQDHLVLKRLDPKHRTASRHNKLKTMLGAGVPDSLLSQLTWPVDLIYENGSFAGYVMPALEQAEDLNAVYSDKYNLTLEERLLVAMNLCVPVAELHKLGQTVGDGNPKNICVNPYSLLVTLVDTDSYSIRDMSSGRIYPCEVGMAPYLAPEVQMALKQYHSLTQVPPDTFNLYTDRFWLAVHIFALLMNGTHPFAVRQGSGTSIAHLAGAQSSVAVPQPDENICHGFFPHLMTKPGLDIPVYCPKFTYLPDGMQVLFRRAFMEGHRNPSARPSPEEWFTELYHMKQSLTSGQHCANPQHQYPSSAGFCPWCELQGRKRLAPKPVPAARQYGTGGSGTGNRNYGGGGRRGRRSGSCLGILLKIILAFAVLMAVPAACTSNLIDIGNREQAYKEQQAAAQLEQIRQEQAQQAAEAAAQEAAQEALLAQRPKGTIQAQDAFSFKLFGALSDSLEEHRFDLDITRAGTYLFEVEQTDLNLICSVCDNTGYSHAYWIADSAGDYSAAELQPGRYTLKAGRQFADTGNFCVKIWMQKETLDISNYNQVEDRMEFRQQSNAYGYTCSQTGTYQIRIDHMYDALEAVSMEIRDSEGKVLFSDWGGIREGFGPHVDLTEGSTYTIYVSEYSGLGGYTLKIS